MNLETTKKFQDQAFAFKKIMLAACMNIFVNYSQNMALINILNLNWKEIATNMFQVHKAVSASVHQMISFDCLIQGFIYKKLARIY